MNATDELRALGRDFQKLTRRRLMLDSAPEDDVQRASVDAEWLAVARAITALPANTAVARRVKAGVIQALAEMGADSAALECARSLTVDLLR